MTAGWPITAVSRDGDGSYTIRNLPPADYGLQVGGWRGTKYPITVAADAVIEGTDFVVPSFTNGVTFSGVVVDTNSNPVANSPVTFEVFVLTRGHSPYGLRGGVPRPAVTGADGEFTLYPVTPDEYRITASVPGLGKSETRTIAVSNAPVTGLTFMVGVPGAQTEGWSR